MDTSPSAKQLRTMGHGGFIKLLIALSELEEYRSKVLTDVHGENAPTLVKVENIGALDGSDTIVESFGKIRDEHCLMQWDGCKCIFIMFIKNLLFNHK